MEKIKSILLILIVPLISVSLIVLGALFEKTLLYIGIALILSYIKLVIHIIMQGSKADIGKNIVVDSGSEDGTEWNACYDLSEYDENSPALSTAEKFKRIKALFVKPKKNAATLSQVQFSAIAPKQLEKGTYATINVAMYEEWARGLVDKIIAEADLPVKETVGSTQSVAQNTTVTITLASPDLDFEQTETQTWQGRFLNFIFCAEIPQSYEKHQALFTANVYFNNVIATRLRFAMDCFTSKKRLSVTREDVLTAFMSYASQDRRHVASLIMGMKKARPDMDIFFDVESLRSGEDWELALRREIKDRDILFLCWSQNAKESKWVDMEWHYALQNKGIDAIEPIPLVSPTVCPPPEELNSKHFNDKFLLYTKE